MMSTFTHSQAAIDVDVSEAEYLEMVDDDIDGSRELRKDKFHPYHLINIIYGVRLTIK